MTMADVFREIVKHVSRAINTPELRIRRLCRLKAAMASPWSKERSDGSNPLEITSGPPPGTPRYGG
jgi:hypothetical protein